MNKRILISTVFISNIIFASVLPTQINQINLNKYRFNTLSNAVSLHLYNRGLDKGVAIKKVSNSLIGQDFENEFMIQNILSNLDEIKYENIVDYLADSALQSREVDLSSYESLIAMVQKIVKSSLDENTLKKVEKISLENKNIKLFQSV